MASRKSPRSTAVAGQSDRPATPHSSDLTARRNLDLDPSKALPKVTLRSVRKHVFLFRKLIGTVDEQARAGDVVSVHTPQGERLGYGLYNPSAELTVRMLTF